jgi:hypothetical protein
MSRTEAVVDQRKTLARINLLEKKAAARKPKVEKATSDLAEAKKEALRKVEEDHERRTKRLMQEVRDIEREKTLLKKRYVELAEDVIREQTQ